MAVDRGELIRDFEEVINKHSAENGSNTPDFILAEYLADCLTAFEIASRAREKWYGHQLVPGEGAVGGVFYRHGSAEIDYRVKE